jgi:hypothetical protein
MFVIAEIVQFLPWLFLVFLFLNTFKMWHFTHSMSKQVVKYICKDCGYSSEDIRFQCLDCESLDIKGYTYYKDKPLSFLDRSLFADYIFLKVTLFWILSSFFLCLDAIILYQNILGFCINLTLLCLACFMFNSVANNIKNTKENAVDSVRG